MTQVNSTNVIAKIKIASKNFDSALTKLHTAVQSLYEIYVVANADDGVAQQISNELKLLANAPSTNNLHMQIAYLAFSINKRRASEIGKVLRVASENGVDASDFVRWVKERGGLSVIYREPENQKSVSKNKSASPRRSDYFKFATKLSAEANTPAIRPSNPSPFALIDDEIAVQCVRRDAAGNYEIFWAKISKTDVDFSSSDGKPVQKNIGIQTLLNQANPVASVANDIAA